MNKNKIRQIVINEICHVFLPDRKALKDIDIPDKEADDYINQNRNKIEGVAKKIIDRINEKRKPLSRKEKKQHKKILHHKYYEEHKEELLLYAKEYNIKNKEKIAKRKAKYYKKWKKRKVKNESKSM